MVFAGHKTFIFLFFFSVFFSSLSVQARDHFRAIFFKNGTAASFQFSDEEPRIFTLNYAPNIIQFHTVAHGTQLSRIQAMDPLAGLDTTPIGVSVYPTAPFASEYSWYQSAEGVFFLFQDGSITKSCTTEPRSEIAAKLISQNGQRYVLESYRSDAGDGATYLSLTADGSHCIKVSNYFYPSINQDTSFLGNTPGSSFFLAKIHPKCNFHIVSHREENYMVSSCVAEPLLTDGTYVLRLRDQKTLRVGFTSLRFPENVHLSLKVQDGILSIPRIHKKVDLEHFDEEVALFGNLKPMEKLTKPDGDSLDVVQEVRTKYPELVSDSRENPARYFQESRPEILTRVAEALRGGRSAVLLGEAGTGKTSAIKAFARDVGLGRVKGFPRTTEIYEITSSSLASSTKYVGTIETRIAELKAMAKGTGAIYFMDELHSFAGTGTHSHQSNDITQQLKGPIEAGELRLLATDTPLEFVDAFAWDLPFVQRFEKISTLAPTASDQTRIIQEQFHSKGYPTPPSELIQAVIELTQRFEPTSEQPRPTVNLMTMVYQRMITLDRPSEVPTLEIVHQVAKEKYGIDPALFQKETLVRKLKALTEGLNQVVIGNEPAKKAIHHVWATKLNGTAHPRRVNSLLLTGPGGVGKSWLIESSARIMGYPINRINMNKYSTRSRLGVDAFQEEIYKAIETHPFTVLVLESIEDADESIQQAIVPMLRDGRFKVTLTHGSGKSTPRDVSVKDALFLITSRVTAEISHAERLSPKELKSELASHGVSESFLSQILYVIPMNRPTAEEFQLGIRQSIQRTLEEQSTLYGATFVLKHEAAYIKAITETFSSTSDYRDIDEAMRGIEIQAQEESLKEEFVSGNRIEIEVETPKKKSRFRPLSEEPIEVQMMYQ